MSTLTPGLTMLWCVAWPGDIWRPVLNLNLELFTQRLNILISVTNPIFRTREFTGVRQRTRVGKSDQGMQP